jgi:GAF domain-containing protein
MANLSLSDTISHVAEFAVRAIPGADGAGLTLLHPDRPDTIVASADFVRVVDDIQYGLGQGPCITAAAEGITVRSGSLETDPQWPEFGPKVGRLGVHSVLSLPLITAGGVLGAMNVYAHRPHAFDARAAELGELFSVPAAISVQNARALASAARLTEQLERALNSRAVIDQAIRNRVRLFLAPAYLAGHDAAGVSEESNRRLGRTWILDETSASIAGRSCDTDRITGQLDRRSRAFGRAVGSRHRCRRLGRGLDHPDVDRRR